MRERIKKIRADDRMVAQGLADTRSRAKTLIMMGKVTWDSRKIAKAGDMVPEDAHLAVEQDMPYVSRGGLKLESALRAFSIDVAGKTCLDGGASTGGFTHCLLINGAAKVYAVDVGYGLLDVKLRSDARVVVIERTNIRHMDAGVVPELVDIIVIDVSFISLTLVIPKLLEFLKPGGELIALIKPQFELTPKDVGAGGIVRDEALRQQTVEKIRALCLAHGMTIIGVAQSGIRGQKGNQEYLIYCRSTPQEKSVSI